MPLPAEFEANTPSYVLPPHDEDAVEARISRRLAAVAFLDIVGYTALMSSDENHTHLRWMKILNEVIRPRISQYRGRLVKLTGDGVLAEFSSALDAVEWAQDIQRLVPSVQIERGGHPPSIALRIAINLGDIIVTESDIYGDGVNVAARLQEHAEPGSVLLSESVYDVVRGTVGRQTRELGYLQLKNLEKPVRAYTVSVDTPTIAVPESPPSGEPSLHSRPAAAKSCGRSGR